ncbi:MAG TPA: hypothetical protein IAB39_04590 [Candidatus Onthovicinus excrementipullorum]|nr:hypothetical protein [Candidatus Onthovicinus excrementipullorum]
MYLDDAKDILEKFEKSTLYFIMSTSKLKIIDYMFYNGKIIVHYENLVTKQINYIENILFFNFNIPYKYIEINISDPGSYIEYGLKDEGIEYLKLTNPTVLKDYDFSKKIKISIYDLVMLNNSKKETIQFYEVLYIGKSIHITKRLSSHEHILKIYRDYNIEHNNLEIMVMVLHPTTKLFQDIEIADLFTTITLGNSKWEEKSFLSQKLSAQEMLDISEALMIRIFKPKYNISFNNDKENFTQKTYNVLFRKKINRIIISFNLFFQKYKEVISIKSKKFNTESKKGIIFTCSIDDLYENKKVRIQTEKLDDKMYKLLE